jgi:hypothetical protein
MLRPVTCRGPHGPLASPGLGWGHKARIDEPIDTKLIRMAYMYSRLLQCTDLATRLVCVCENCAIHFKMLFSFCKSPCRSPLTWMVHLTREAQWILGLLIKHKQMSRITVDLNLVLKILFSLQLNCFSLVLQ